MIHFYMSLSGGSKYEFQAEVFVRSLEQWGSVPYCLTICQNPGDTLESPYLRRRAEVITHNHKFDPLWYGGLASCPQKGCTTVYTDTDMLVVGDLSPITSNDCACGVIAYQSPFTGRHGWQNLFDSCGVPLKLDYTTNYDKQKVPFYPNLGFVAVPSDIIPQLNEAMLDFLLLSDQVMPHHYHRPQFAMCLALAALKVKVKDLPVWCNYPDLYGELSTNPDKAIVFHLLRTKSKIECWKDLKSPDLPDNKTINRILSKMRFLAGTRTF